MIVYSSHIINHNHYHKYDLLHYQVIQSTRRVQSEVRLSSNDYYNKPNSMVYNNPMHNITNMYPNHKEITTQYCGGKQAATRFKMSKVAPERIRSSTISACPCLHARCKAVDPS